MKRAILSLVAAVLLAMSSVGLAAAKPLYNPPQSIQSSCHAYTTLAVVDFARLIGVAPGAWMFGADPSWAQTTCIRYGIEPDPPTE